MIIKAIHKLDVVRLIQRFGGINELRKRLLNHQVDINHKTVEKWRERKQIPSWRLLQLIALAKSEGQPIDVLDYASTQTK
jgi:hypothetical protein